MVASNAPFAVLSEGAVGDMSLRLTVNGTINGKAFGGQAQNPGQISDCVTPTTTTSTALYTATKRTAARRGEIIDQAVMIHIKYDPSLTPNFTVKTLNEPEVKTAGQAQVCAGVAS